MLLIVVYGLNLPRKYKKARYILAYDNIKSVRFFGSELVDWWARGGKKFDTMREEAIIEAKSVEAKCQAFDKKFRRDMEKIGGEKICGHS